MKLQYVLFCFTITVLFGCGEDTSSRRRGEIFLPTVTDDNFIVPSHIHKNRELTVLESRAISSMIVSGSLPEGYRIVPEILTDDETVTTLPRPDTDCGSGDGISVTERIQNCSTTNGPRAIFNGSRGRAGESTWRLVAKIGGDEIWIDTRTGLLWSYVVAVTNWCNASGNNQTVEGAVVDCAELGKDFACIGKNLMNLTGISWRLPTRNDYLQADLDGLRYVLASSGNLGTWTATIDSASAGRNQAWLYNQEQGTLISSLLTEARNVRCVGAANL